MVKTLAILGAGDLGRQIAHYAISDGHYGRVVFFDDVLKNESIHGLDVLGTSEEVEGCFVRNEFDEILIGIGYKHLHRRKELYERFSSKVPFGRVIHTSACVDPSAEIRPGCVIFPGCLIDTKCIILENTILNVSATIAHDTVIGKHCFLSPRVAIAGFVRIGERCMVGINCTVIDNVSICAGTQIGGGSVVIKGIEVPGLYVGNPSRLIR